MEQLSGEELVQPDALADITVKYSKFVGVVLSVQNSKLTRCARAPRL